MTAFKLNKTVLLLVCLLLSACQTTPSTTGAESSPAQSDLTLDTLIKTDMDMVYDHHIRSLDQLLRQLMHKLYLRNPLYFRQYGAQSAQQRVTQVYDRSIAQQVRFLNNKKSVAAIRLTFDENYKGDRVAAFVLGLRTMLDDAHGNQRQLFMLDQLDPQRLYNAARNIEVAVWKLSNDRDSRGELFQESQL